MKIQIEQDTIITLIVIIGIIKTILIFWKLKMPHKGIIFVSIILFFLNIILSANVGILIFYEALKRSIQYGELSANIISICFGVIGLKAEAEKPIQSYSHSIDKDNKIR